MHPYHIKVDISMTKLGVDMFVDQSLALLVVVKTDVCHRDGREEE